MTDETMSETCDVNGCENDARTTCKVKDDNGKIMFEKVFCRNHMEQLFFGER